MLLKCGSKPRGGSSSIPLKTGRARQLQPPVKSLTKEELLFLFIKPYYIPVLSSEYKVVVNIKLFYRITQDVKRKKPEKISKFCRLKKSSVPFFSSLKLIIYFYLHPILASLLARQQAPVYASLSYR